MNDDSPEDGHECQLLLDLYKRGNASHDAYVTLESFYSSQGLRRLANKVYVAGQQVETRKLGKGLFRSGEIDPPPPLLQRAKDFFFWLGRLGWDVLCGYGHRLWTGAIWCVSFIVIGMLVFHHEKLMDLHAHHVMAGSDITVTPDKDKVAAFSPFWYSVDLFIPLLDLGDARTWMPKKEKPLLRFYRRVHIIAGALLLPITLAALTGLID